MIRILVVPSGDYLGHPFPQRQNQIFERLHDGKNFEVHMVSFRLFDKPHLETRLIMHELDGKRINQVAPYYLVNSVNHTFQIRRIIKNEGVDVVVLSNLATPFAYTLMDQISSSRIPIIFDLPDHYPTSAASYIFGARRASGKLLVGMFDFILSFMMRRASVVTVASNALGEYAKGAGAHQVVCVPNGIAECFLELHDGNALREKFGYSREDLVVGYIGSLEFWLDMRSLIDGVTLVKRMGLSIRLLIVGSRLYTNYSEKVERWVKQKNIEKQTKLLGFVPHEVVPEYISGLDVGVIPFDVSNPIAQYASPNKMWEYFSQRKPVLSTPIPEALNNSDCVLTALTPEDYAHQLLLVANKKTEVDQKVETGYQKALDRTWTNSARFFGSTVYSLVNQA
jgi:glycosyltransferase involved in cell wall biosynthesis